MKYAAILFDFDYTLADSSARIVTCFQNVLNRHSFDAVTDYQIKLTIGKPLEASFSLLTGITDPGKLEMLRQQYTREADTYMTANTFLYPGTLPVLEELRARGIQTGIISTKYRYRILEFLESQGIAGLFDLIIGGEDVTRHKPDPEGLELAIRTLAVPHEQALYVGDSTADAGTAAQAGVSFAGITSGMTTAAELAAYPHISILADINALSEIV